ncbi:MAG: 16S rRNA (guanine(966)-N(2))-methyltransferase RsmD [Acidobacteria bacterium]|nr:16S rRNA (guanine(966)-N(2))-methyltransferase RsmD [Acidobacteriota bacterium]
MRIIGGRLKGRQLLTVPGLAVRPTIARLKESYFNIVGEEIAGARFLDLCAGAGSMGIEALSRGAAEAIFVEKSRPALAVLRRNLAKCGLTSGYRIVAGDLFRELPRLAAHHENVDLIYFDPPYFENLYESTLELVARQRLLAQGGLLAADHFKKTPLPSRVGELVRVRQVRHGDAVLSFYAWTAPMPSVSGRPGD